MRQIFQAGPEGCDHDLIDRFIKNRLDAERRQAVELRMLEDDDFFEEVLRTDALHDCLQAEQKRLCEGVKPGYGPRAAFLARASLTAAWLRQPLSLAACLLLAVSLALQLQAWLGAQDGLLGVPSHTLVETLRGGQEISVRGSAPHLLQVDAGLDAAPVHEVLLRDRDSGELLFHEPAVPADDAGWLRILITEELQGAHVLELHSESGTLRYALDFKPDLP